MKTIQIVTPQNVLIEHELASVIMRGIAFILDQIIIFVFLIFAFVLLEFFAFGSAMEEIFLFIFIIPVYFLYSLLFEAYNYGQSLGKMALGLKVRRLDGNEVTFTEAITRWLMRVPDIFISAGSLAAILISSTERSQRLGDILAGTIVIRQVASTGISLENLMKINNTSNYSPVYPEVLQLKETDVVLIKQTLVRQNKYKNQAHDQAVSLLATRLKKLLKLTPKEKTNELFLKTLIKDYIVLTR